MGSENYQNTAFKDIHHLKAVIRISFTSKNVPYNLIIICFFNEGSIYGTSLISLLEELFEMSNID